MEGGRLIGGRLIEVALYLQNKTITLPQYANCKRPSCKKLKEHFSQTSILVPTDPALTFLIWKVFRSSSWSLRYSKTNSAVMQSRTKSEHFNICNVTLEDLSTEFGTKWGYLQIKPVKTTEQKGLLSKLKFTAENETETYTMRLFEGQILFRKWTGTVGVNDVNAWNL